jgi:uncharacterized membrane protein YhaH (DUF805 family)
MRRSSYLIVQVVLGVIYFVGRAAFESGNEAIAVFLLIGADPLCWVTASVRRIHDMDMSGSWLALPIIACFVSYVVVGLLGLGPGFTLIAISIGLVFSLMLLFCSGTKGPNQYGPDPRN